MVNCTTDILSGCKYNVTSIINADILTQPYLWLAKFNALMNNYAVVTIYYAILLVAFLIMRNIEDDNLEAIKYVGLVGTLFGILLFIIDISGVGLVKLLSWQQIMPLIVITAFAIILERMNKNIIDNDN